ncbi:MAG TPA: hypothetical protein V6C95_11910 [Coleofasciculaceae cyanobacterium]
MDAVQKQIIALSHKIDTLYQMIEQLSRKVSDALSDINQSSAQDNGYSQPIANARSQSYKVHSLLDSVMEHKDVLMDGNSDMTGSPQSSENSLSADIQVQRLTAQLTAAYNRIAALEEQLLARRIHT